jgi:transcriptional repressor NrdR
MHCPYCGEDNDKVVDSRSSEGGRVVRRRRHCQTCNRRFTTYERVEESLRLMVIKKDDSREPYHREKLINGLEKCCYKRPISEEQVRHVVDTVEEKIFRQFDKEVPSSYIGDAVAEQLREIDKIAYVRFASVYREFADVGDLINEAQQIEQQTSAVPGQKNLFG